MTWYDDIVKKDLFSRIFFVGSCYEDIVYRILFGLYWYEDDIIDYLV